MTSAAPLLVSEDAILPRALSSDRTIVDRSELEHPFDMAAIARGFGAYGARIEKAEDVGPGLIDALASGRPALLDMIVDESV